MTYKKALRSQKHFLNSKGTIISKHGVYRRKEKYGFYSCLMQLSVIADKSTCMCNIQIAFSPIPLISTNKLTLIESSQK